MCKPEMRIGYYLLGVDYAPVFCMVSSNFMDSHSTDRNDNVRAGKRISVAYDILPEYARPRSNVPADLRVRMLKIP